MKVSPMKDVMRSGKKGKLSPWYIRPYRISKIIVNVAYKLELPVFHISMLKKWMEDPLLIIRTKIFGIKDSLFYKEILVKI